MAVFVWCESSLLPSLMLSMFLINGWTYHPDLNIPLETIIAKVLKCSSAQVLSQSTDVKIVANMVDWFRFLDARCTMPVPEIPITPLTELTEFQARGLNWWHPHSMLASHSLRYNISYKDNNSDRSDGA